jgi:hypothetical protein
VRVRVEGAGGVPGVRGWGVRRRVRSVTLRVLLFAAIGAAATVIVAWACVAARPVLAGPVIYPTHFFHGETLASACRRGSPFADSFSVGDRWMVEAGPLRFYTTSGGAPLLALAETEENLRSNPAQASDDRICTVTLLGRRLPCIPLWPGFLVDTAFWGGAAFLVWSGRGGAGFVRRGVRRRRGRCVGCGYELKGLAVCPECGS